MNISVVSLVVHGSELLVNWKLMVVDGACLESPIAYLYLGWLQTTNITVTINKIGHVKRCSLILGTMIRAPPRPYHHHHEVMGIQHDPYHDLERRLTTAPPLVSEISRSLAWSLA